MDNLRQKTFSGIVWNLTERVGLRIIQFLPTILLARLLDPDQFGLIGMLSIFILLAQTFLDGGFGLALIQKKNATRTDECSIFYFNIFVGGSFVILLYFTAPLIADFYGQPLLVPLTRWLSLDILLKALSLIQTARLSRSMDFKAQVKANLFATLLGGTMGVAAAYGGFGVWSLVIQTLSGSLLRTLALWRMSAWRPTLTFSIKALEGLFKFGSHMLFSNLVSTFMENLYQVFIGKTFSATALGYYTRASSLKSVAIDTTSDVFGRVLFPAMSMIQDDIERLKRAYRKSILLATAIHFPLMMALIVVARPLVTLLFSAKWQETILFFQLMCGAGLLYPLQSINLEILKVKGRSDLFFRLTLIKRTLMVLAIVITYRWGISAMLIGQIANSLIAYFINSYYSKKLIGYPVKDQVRDFLPALSYSVIMAGGMWGVGRLLPVNNWILLGTQLLTGSALYLLLHILARTPPMKEFLALTKRWSSPGLKS